MEVARCTTAAIHSSQTVASSFWATAPTRWLGKPWTSPRFQAAVSKSWSSDTGESAKVGSIVLPQDDLDAIADAALDAFNTFEGRLRGAAAAEAAKLGAADRAALRRALERIAREDKRAIEIVVRDTLHKSAQRSLLHDEATYEAARAAGIIAPYAAISESAALDEILADGIAKAQSLANLVRTSAVERVYADFIDALDSSMVSLTLETVGPDAAVRHAIKRVATATTKVSYIQADGTVLEQGLYGAVRRAVLTGANQTTARLTMTRAAEAGALHFEVSAHLGARPEHAEWQGGVYTIDQLVEVCGYGDGAGLAGWNCRHQMYPFFPGVSEPGDWGWAEDPSGEQYELSQRQRTCERNIRGYKARSAGYSGVVNETKDPATKAWAKGERDRADGLKRKWANEADIVVAKRNGARRGAREVGKFAQPK